MRGIREIFVTCAIVVDFRSVAMWTKSATVIVRSSANWLANEDMMTLCQTRWVLSVDGWMNVARQDTMLPASFNKTMIVQQARRQRLPDILYNRRVKKLCQSRSACQRFVSVVDEVRSHLDHGPRYSAQQHPGDKYVKVKEECWIPQRIDSHAVYSSHDQYRVAKLHQPGTSAMVLVSTDLNPPVAITTNQTRPTLERADR